MENDNIKYPGWDNEKSYIKTIEEGGRIKYFGNFNMGFCNFEFVLIQQGSGRYAFRGRITAVDRKGIKLCKNKKDSVKKEYISAEINLNEVSEAIIMAVIEEKATKLYADNYEVIFFDLKKKTNPNTISLLEAAVLNAEKFVALRHAEASPEGKARYVRRIIRTCGHFPNIPMSKYTKNKFKLLLKQTNIENSEILTELYEFWQYCIDMRICVGNNPVEKPPNNKNASKLRKHHELQKNTELSIEQQDALFDILEEDINGISAAVALLASNINTKIIEKLKWKDIQFFKEDYAVVKIYDSKRAGATHNLSRPVLPRTALVLHKLYDKQKKNYGEGAIDNMPICSLVKTPEVAVRSARIVDEATRMVMLVISNTDSINSAKALEPKIAAVRTIFSNTYRNNLLSICNLDEDNIVYKYLNAGNFTNDVSLDHYANLSCKPGWDLSYTIMAPLRKLKKNTKKKDFEKDGEKHIFCVPETNHEFSKVTVTIKLSPGERITIKCPHGVVGTTKVRGPSEDGIVSKK